MARQVYLTYMQLNSVEAVTEQQNSDRSEQLVTSLNIVNTFLGNKYARGVINSFLTNSNNIHDALRYYVGQATSGHTSLLKMLPILAFIELGRLAFKKDKSGMKDYFSRPVTQRGLANIIRSILEYGVTRPQKLSSPFLVVWNYTNACNLKCQHCYQTAGHATRDELTLEEKLSIIDQLAENDVVAIAFSGGEAMLRDDFWEVTRYAHGRGLYLSLATNGTLLTKENVTKLKNCGFEYFEISLDSTDPVKHDAFRGVTGAWDRTIRGIENVLAEDGLYSCIATTLTRDNLAELDELVLLSKNIGVNRSLFFNFIPVGRGMEIIDKDLSPEQREEALQKMYGYLRGEASGFEVLSTAPQFARVCQMSSPTGVTSLAHFGTIYFFGDKASTLAELIGGCGAGRMYCAIQPNGIVTPCVFMPIEVGNLKISKFMDIWKRSDVLAALRERHDLKGHCGLCHYRNICGGCRARAYAYFHDIKAPDIGCVNNSSIYREIVDAHVESVPKIIEI